MKHNIRSMAGIAGGIILVAGMVSAQSPAPADVNASAGAANSISAPTDVNASDGTFSDKVRVTWSAVIGATGYEVWRESSGGGGNSTSAENSHGAGNSDGGGNKIADVTTNMYDDTSAVVGTNYTYRIKTKDGTNTSDFSASDTGWRGNNYACVVNVDFDGDGLPDPTVYQDTTGRWIIMQSKNHYATLDLANFLGASDYVAAVADYDGDSKADFAVYQASTGNWKFKFSGGIFASPYALVEFNSFLGGPGKTPAVADYDGDGKADPAVYEAATSVWSVKQSGQSYAQTDF